MSDRTIQDLWQLQGLPLNLKIRMTKDRIRQWIQTYGENGVYVHLEKPGEGRFELMKNTHPKQYDYIMRPWEEGGLNYKEVIDWINEHGNLHIRY